MYQAAGYRDGLFVSPHVSSFRERIQIRGELISEEAVIAGLPMIVDLCAAHKLPATFFELTTALAFHHFRDADAVALEVGLGGRLDATNVVTPTVSVICSIGLDHTRILGETVEEIAMEKAGIMKRGIPVRTVDVMVRLCARVCGLGWRGTGRGSLFKEHDLTSLQAK